MLTGIELGRAIRAALEQNGKTPADAARHFNVRPPSVSGWMATGRISKTHFNDLVRWLDKTPLSHWGLQPTQHGNAAPQNDGALVSLDSFRLQKSKPPELVIPQFDTGGAMGGGLLLRDQPGVIRGWSVSTEWVAKNIRSHTGAANLVIVTGFGDSMKGMFNSGDPLVVDTGVKTVEYDAVYFFRVGEEGFIKRLQRIPGEGLRVLSENKQYDAWTIKPNMDFEVFGRVVKAWQGEDF
jgi:hypothetical protein